jgi:hypothetical protein
MYTYAVEKDLRFHRTPRGLRDEADREVACGEQLVVTSALRPTTRQPRNGSARSVHPTGLAIDLRKPGGACLRWLRKTLLRMEQQRLIEATEEFRPPHFHVAVFGDRFWSCVDESAATRLAGSGAPTAVGAG